MQLTTNFKGIRLTNIPSANLREQFFNHYHMIKEGGYDNQLQKWSSVKVIETPYLDWYYWPEAFATYITQHAITGVESYICGAVYTMLGRNGNLKENIGFIKDPFSIPGGKGTAEKLYKSLPCLHSDAISLPACNDELWKSVKLFYREVRNPLFHGMQFESGKSEYLLEVFELLSDVYGWIDSWHDPNTVIPGSAWFTKLRR